MTDLRDYQLEAIEELDRHRRPLLGKTVIASEIIKRNQHKHVLFLAHRRELVFQPRDHLAEFGVTAGIILAKQPMDMMRRVQVASIQTIWSRCIRGKKDLPPADLVFIDEAHRSGARTYRRIIEAYPNAKIIGMTATPCRQDGRGLGSTFDSMVECPQIEKLIKLGWLVPTKVFAPYAPDLKGVTTRNGDYAEKQLAQIMDHGHLVGDLCEHWHRLNPERRPTVVFATSVAHSIHIKDEFIKSGLKAEHIDGKTDKAERDEILARLASGDLELVSNCQVLSEGWDQPVVSCCVLARPTKSLGLFRQMVGRVLRPYPGKDHALILDHRLST